jgi:hypothetical protein
MDGVVQSSDLTLELERLAKDAHYLAIHLNGSLELPDIDSAHETCVDLAARLADLARRVAQNGNGAHAPVH